MWNVGMSTDRRRRNIDIWKQREIDEVYKIKYLEKASTRNGIVVIVNEEMKERMVEVVEKNDYVITMVKVVVEDKVLNIICVYALQVGFEESQKVQFWQKKYEVMQGIIGSRILWLKSNINEHVGKDRLDYNSNIMHGRHRFGCRNKDRKKVLNFV